jgi:hypothetical protein
MGAYTKLWAGLSPELTMEMNGGYVIPWGRIHPSPRKDLLDALKSVEEGGTGQAGEFQAWCKKQTEMYLQQWEAGLINIGTAGFNLMNWM